MSLFPWDDWFYHISQKKKEVNDLYNQYLQQRDTIVATGGSYNQYLDTAQSMMAWNYSLLLLSSVAHMDDSDYGSWLKQNETDKPADPEHSTVIEVMQGLTELYGTFEVAKFVWNIGKSAKNALFRQGVQDAEQAAGGEAGGVEGALGDEALAGVEDLGLSAEGDAAAGAIGDAAADAGAEAGSEAAAVAVEGAVEGASSAAMGVAATGGAIFIAVGIDAILGAIDGAKERDQLNASIDKLKKALDTVTKYSAALDAKLQSLKDKVVEQETLFLANMKNLKAIQPPSFDYDFAATLDNMAKFKTSMHAASTEYGFLMIIRDSWNKMKANKPDLTWDLFSMFMQMDRPTSMSEALANAYLDYAANHMSVAMKNAQAEAAKPAAARSPALASP